MNYRINSFFPQKLGLFPAFSSLFPIALGSSFQDYGLYSWPPASECATRVWLVAFISPSPGIANSRIYQSILGGIHALARRPSQAIHRSNKEHFMRRTTFVLLLIVLTSAGCSQIMSKTMPPQKIPMDRGNYLDAVSTSWREQLLNNLVKLRYGHTLTCLEMTNVITSYELDASLSAGYPIAWHPLRGTAGFRNVVGVGGAAGYSDKPSITYVPTRGDALSETMIEPISASKILKSLQTGWYAGYIFSCCVESINHLRNRSPSAGFAGDSGFPELYQRFDDLLLNGVIRIAVNKAGTETTEREKTSEQKTEQKAEKKKKNTTMTKTKTEDLTEKNTTKEDRDDIVIGFILVDKEHAKTRKLQDELKSFIDLLGLNQNFCEYKVIDGNRQAIQCKINGDKIVIQTRSILSVLVLLSQFVDVPDKHIEENRAQNSKLLNKKENIKEPLFYGPPDNPKIFFEIKHSEKPPIDSFVAIKYREGWFYIDDMDLNSKDSFSSTAAILSMSQTGTTSQATPLLTLPVQ